METHLKPMRVFARTLMKTIPGNYPLMQVMHLTRFAL